MKHGCMVMTLRLSSSRRSGSRQIHRSRQQRVNFAAMSSSCWSFFSNIQGTVHKEFILPDQTFNDRFYCEVLKRLREGIRRRRPDKWKNNNWFLHHDNAPTHTLLVVRQFLTSKYITLILPSRLFSWPRPLRLFPVPQDEITAERTSFWHYWGDPRRIARGYRHTHIWELPGMHEIWETRWDRCIHVQGGCFEGDGGN